MSIKRVGTKKYTDEFLDKMYQEYLENGANSASIKFHINNSTSILRQRGYKIRSHKEYVKFHQDKRFSMFNINFNEINDEYSAYILGLIYSDGCVQEKIASVSIIQNDFELLKQIQTLVGGSSNILKSTNGSSFQLSFYSKIIAQNIINLGIETGKGRKIKNYPKFADFNQELSLHFIRGFFDGDGHSAKTPGNGYTIGFNLTNYDFLEYLMHFLEENGLEHGHISLIRPKGSICSIRGHSYITNYNTYSLRFSNKTSVKKFYELMYTNCNICLKRKYEKIKLHVDTVLTEKQSVV
jgi:hypothetical protein